MDLLYVFGGSVVVLLIALVISLLYGRKRHEGLVGHMIVDPNETNDGEGIYFQFDVDPRKFREGEVIELGVWRAKSQEKHGR